MSQGISHTHWRWVLMAANMHITTPETLLAAIFTFLVHDMFRQQRQSLSSLKSRTRRIRHANTAVNSIIEERVRSHTLNLTRARINSHNTSLLAVKHGLSQALQLLVQSRCTLMIFVTCSCFYRKQKEKS